MGDRSPWKPWSAGEDALLTQLGGGDARFSDAEWKAISDHFPDRTPRAVRYRCTTLRSRAAGRIRQQPRAANPKYVRVTVREAMQSLPPLPKPSSLTAQVFGDPLPGRSALDKKREGAHA